MYSTAWRRVSTLKIFRVLSLYDAIERFYLVPTLDIFLCFAADGMWLLSTSNPQLTCFTLFLSLAFLRATFAGCGGGIAYPSVGWNAVPAGTFFLLLCVVLLVTSVTSVAALDAPSPDEEEEAAFFGAIGLLFDGMITFRGAVVACCWLLPTRPLLLNMVIWRASEWSWN